MMCWTACRSQPLESPDTQKKHLSSWLSNFVKLPPTWKGKNFCIEKNSCPHTEHKSFSLLKDNLHQWFLSSCTFLVQATAGTSAGALQYSQYAGWGREWYLTAFLWFVLAKQHFFCFVVLNGLKHTLKLTPSLATQLLLLIAFIFLNYSAAKFYVLIQNSVWLIQHINYIC